MRFLCRFHFQLHQSYGNHTVYQSTISKTKPNLELDRSQSQGRILFFTSSIKSTLIRTQNKLEGTLSGITDVRLGIGSVAYLTSLLITPPPYPPPHLHLHLPILPPPSIYPVLYLPTPTKDNAQTKNPPPSPYPPPSHSTPPAPPAC